jgi:DmsE family decaheme c-type cytochrome
MRTRPSRSPRILGARPWLSILLVASFLLACVTTWTPLERSYHRITAVKDAGAPVGADECRTCHEDEQGRTFGPEGHADCEACHGPGELHADSEEPQDIRFPSSSDCVNCHEKGRSTLLAWTTAEHRRAGVLCSDCHDSHNREPHNVRKASDLQGTLLRHASGTTQMCVTCHTDVAASLSLPSHHPTKEGMLDCTSCHSPHESRRMTLGARTTLCTGCHESEAGPWIYEHAPVTEDCGYCHAPHGTSARNLLSSSEPGVCVACHSLPEMGATHDPQAYTTRCSDCHSAVHGSFADPHLRR